MSSKKGSSAGEAHAIVVGIRVRPFNQREMKFNSSCIVSMEGNCTRIHEIQNGKPLMVKPREFVFDYAFWTHSKDGSGAPAPMAGSAPSAPPPFADQQYVYERLGVQIVQNVFEGFNSCLFAYGQTGSGKTYSMMGVPSDPGMLPRIGTDIFERAEAILAAGNECTVKASFCELYNEKCRDLLASPTGDGGKSGGGGKDAELKIRMHPQTGVFVEGITSYTLNSPEEYFRLLERGLSHRTTASTNMNATSSRSHGIVLLTVFQKDCNGSKTGKMSLVDLAGSERMAATGATGATAVEGQNINRSLTTLGMVLSKLAEKANSAGGGDKGAAPHIPYRDSQLTFLLMDNLGGNSKTSMIAAISPASVNYDETLSTLRFSSVAKKVKSVATVNEDPNDKLIRELKVELGELRDRLKRLQEQKKAKAAAAMAIGATSDSSIIPAPSPTPAAGVQTVDASVVVPPAPPASGEIIEAQTFPSSTPEPTPTPSDVTATPPPQDALAVNDELNENRVTSKCIKEDTNKHLHHHRRVHIDPQYLEDRRERENEEKYLKEEASTEALEEQIELDEGALHTLVTPPLSGRRLLEDKEMPRVQLFKTTSAALGGVSAPNLLLVHHNTLNNKNNNNNNNSNNVIDGGSLDEKASYDEEETSEEDEEEKEHFTGDVVERDDAYNCASDDFEDTYVAYRRSLPTNRSVSLNQNHSTSQPIIVPSRGASFTQSVTVTAIATRSRGNSSAVSVTSATLGSLRNVALTPTSTPARGHAALRSPHSNASISPDTTPTAQQLPPPTSQRQSNTNKLLPERSSTTPLSLTIAEAEVALAAAKNQDEKGVTTTSQQRRGSPVMELADSIVVVANKRPATMEQAGNALLSATLLSTAEGTLLGTADSIVVESPPPHLPISQRAHLHHISPHPPVEADAEDSKGLDLADSVGVLQLADTVVIVPKPKTSGGTSNSAATATAADTFAAAVASLHGAADSIAEFMVPSPESEDETEVGGSTRKGAKGKRPSVSHRKEEEAGKDHSNRAHTDNEDEDGDHDDHSDASNERRNFAMFAAADAEHGGPGEDDEHEEGEDAEEGEGGRREVMVDWRAPQLINLRPEAGGDVLIIPLAEGQTECEMDDVNVYFFFDALASVVTIFSDTSGAVFLNGIPIEDEGTVLRHNDRIVVGENAFRFAFTAQDACDFKTDPVSIDHLTLLERYGRMQIIEERSKNAISIGKAYFNNLAIVSGGAFSAPTLNMTPRGGSGMTPRSSNSLLAVIGDDSSCTNQIIYEIEQQLCQEYPADAEDIDETHIAVDMAQYNEALDERARMLRQQQDEMDELREMLERQNRLAAAAANTSSPMRRAEASEVAVVQESINAACSEAILQRELLWHRQVKALKAFKPIGGPSDLVDRRLWCRLDTDPPFASDPFLKLERAITIPISDPKTKGGEGGSRKWTNRFVACTRQFAFIFRQTNDVLPCLGAVYLPGAQITAPSDRVSRIGGPSDQSGGGGGDGDTSAPQFIVEVAPAVTRSISDTSVSSHQCSVRLGFDDEVTMLSWRQFFEECAAPQMPLSMLKRWTKEFVASHGTISVFADPVASAAGSSVRGDMMPARMRWKPDSSTDKCEDCRKPFMLIIRGKHHCRGCGGIFCADCLKGKGEEKKCENCRYTFKRATRNAVRRAGAGSVLACRRTNIMSEFELRRPHLLRETFNVRIEIVSNPSDAETVRRLHIPSEALQLAKASGNTEVTDDFDCDGIISFQIDHYRGRAHTFTGDEILRLERSLLVPTILTLHTTDNAIIRMSFEDAMARERCVESLLVLMGCRVYMPGLRDVVEVSNVVVTNDVGEDCFFRMTNTIAVDAKLWVGIEDGRTIPFHESYAVWAFVGHKETWNEQSLKTFRLCLLEQAQLSGDSCLYVVCSLEWRHNIMAVTPCPVSRSRRYTVGAIGIRMLESTVLFVGVHQPTITCDDFVDVGASPRDDKLFSLGHISTTNLPVVDALQQYDHAFLINSPGLPQFLQANPVVHYSSPTVEVLLAGRSSVELVVPCVGFTCSKFCDRPCERPVFKLLGVTILESKSSSELPIDRIPKGDIVSQCQLWCSMGFDRVYDGDIVTDPTRLHGMPCSLAQTSAYSEVMLVNGMAEYCSLGKLFVVCADMGSIAINIAQVMAPRNSNPSAAAPVVSEIVCEILRGGKVMAIAEIKLSSWWAAGYTGIHSEAPSRKPSMMDE